MIRSIRRIVIVSNATLEFLFAFCNAKFTFRNHRFLDTATLEHIMNPKNQGGFIYDFFKKTNEASSCT